AATACTVGTAATSNTDPGLQKTALDFRAENASFRSIGFTIADPVYYQYGIQSALGSGCGRGPNTDFYSLQAIGDLDGDDLNSLFEFQAGSNGENELMRSPGLFRQDELE
ncbi:MAG: hypothetical protein K8H88_17460, partial [Sandaracinaceae bacterium]|nr:hypothetical protein [Sandaracinaceae bacterium]